MGPPPETVVDATSTTSSSTSDADDALEAPTPSTTSTTTVKPCRLSLTTTAGRVMSLPTTSPRGGTIIGLRSPRDAATTPSTPRSGLLVLLAASPSTLTMKMSSSTPATPCASPRGGSTDADVDPLAGHHEQLQLTSEAEDAHPAPLPSRGIIQKFRKRLLSVDNSKNAVAASGQTSSECSPRRPLFVDTQLANGGKDKRSPVSTVVDFMRGRHRTNSLSGSPLVSPQPQPVGARSSVSADAQPLFSPGRRPPLSRLYQRSSFSTGMRSFDSGLDLTSPTFNHTALLIKEASLFSSFDSMTIGTAANDINAVFFDNHDAVYSLFMKAHKCYDLIPTSTKLVVFDTHLPVRKAFYALVYNGVRAAPLWDSDKQQFTGMLTITDFIKILIRHYEAGDTAERMRALEDQEINHWREQFEQDGSLRTLVAIDPNESLHRAVQVLCESKVHRLPVLDRRTGNITYILTHKRLIKFLSLYMHDLPRPTFMSCTPHELGIGSWGDVLCCHVDTPLHDALDLFLKNRVSALPLVDQDGRVVDIYAKFDVISLAAENSYDKLDCTVQEALSHRSEWFEGVHTCLESDSLFTVLETIVKAEVHRLIVTDKEKKVVGVISLSDILKYLVLDPVQEPPPQPSTQTQTQSTPMPRNVSGSTACSNDSPPSSIPEGVEIDDDDN